MARNEEKAQSMLNRYLQMKNKEHRAPAPKRPLLAAQEKSLVNAERWRRQLIAEICTKVNSIQNDTLGESKIRDLNDEINKLFKDKAEWERRIIELGGANYHSVSLQIAEDEGVEVEGMSGYRYFGAAKKLKGVEELLKPDDKKVKVNREEILQNIDADYYGYRDDDNDELSKIEAVIEEKERQAEIQEWNLLHEGISQMDYSSSDGEEYDMSAYVVPTKEEMDQILLEKQKEEVLRQYVNPAMKRAILAEKK